jgi:CBS domain-containing protein
MAECVRDVMSTELKTVEPSAKVSEAAGKMRDSDVGAIPVIEDGELRGLLTDRDIVVAVVAEGKDPDDVKVGDIASGDLTTLAPDASIDEALKTMREGKVRRLPVMEDDKPVGIVSLGDLAIEREPKSALGEISEAPASN